MYFLISALVKTTLGYDCCFVNGIYGRVTINLFVNVTNQEILKLLRNLFIEPPE